ncbi:MAG TPA: SusC/RagA family TonB-linked outer membrane protein [Gemmatimonadaceae bacterium]|nr:SusC/RagA family TonB-linked outer membrane protein [Gemmatimonadaceae bacterium]
MDLLSVAAAISLVAATAVPAAAQQEATITGTVKSRVGAPLASASVFVQELRIGGLTGEDGTYRLVIPAARVNGQRVTLAVRLIGYREATAPLTLTPGPHTQDFVLDPNPLRLGEVVVTGAGTATTREKLGNVINTVDSSIIRRSNEHNVVEALAGKAPNIQVNQESGEAGASSSIQIRGLKTMTGTGQPLFVVDGVPIDNSTEATSDPTGIIESGVGGSAATNRAADINPNDIESVEILKGAAAGAIYGARAGQGVILITTKKGTAGQTRYSLHSSYSFDDVNKKIPLNTTFGHGSGGVTPACDASNVDTAQVIDCGPATSSSWGPQLAPGTPIFNHFDELFDTGHTWDNILSVSGGSERTLFYLSGGRTAQNGIIVGPNNFYNRTTVHANASHRLFDNLNIGANISYVDDRGSFTGRGSNVSGLMLGAMRTPPEFNNVEYLDPTSHLQRSYRFPFPSVASSGLPRGYDNPFFVIFEQPNNSEVSRTYGNINADWSALDWLDVKETFSADYSTDARLTALPLTSSNQPIGQVTRNDITSYQLDHNLVATATHTFNPNFSGSLALGQNLNTRNFRNVAVTGVGLVAANPLILKNTTTITPNDSQAVIHTESYFGQATADLFNQLYLTAALRNDGFSSFGVSSRRHWFPKASAAWAFRQQSSDENQIFSYGKLRFAYGETGTEPVAYLTNQVYQSGVAISDAGWGDFLLTNQGGNGGLVLGPTKEQPNLGPERTKEFEAGLDFGLFGPRADGSLTLYHDKTVGVIFRAALPNSTGFINQAQNAATIRNRGIEAQLNVRPLMRENLTWEVGLQWGKNENRVIDLAGQQFVDLLTSAQSSFTGTVATAWKGSEVGVLRGNDYARCGLGLNIDGTDIDAACGSNAPKGALYIGPDGFPILDPTQRVIAVGSPKWTGSIRTSLTFRKLQISGLLDIKHGGQVWNGTRGALYNFGAHKDMDIRNKVVVIGKDWLPGPVAGPGAGTPIDFSAIDTSTGVTVAQGFFQDIGGGFGPVAAQFVEDGGYTKLREISVAYTFDQPWVRRALGLSSIGVRVAGRNLHTWTKYSGIDPETNLSGALGAIQDVDYFNNPQTRSFVLTFDLNR